MINYLFIVIGIIWLVFASIFDIKTREIPDWLNYSLIVIGLGLRAIYSFEVGFKFLLYGLTALIFAFLLGSLMYYFRQWGGGDVKLLMGMGAMFGSFDFIGLDLPFFLVFMINMFITGAFVGILWGFVLAFINRKKFLKELKKIDFRFFNLSLLFSVILFIIGLFLDLLIIIFFSVFLLLIILLFIFMKTLERCCMYKMISVNKLTEGDLLVNDIINKGKVIISYKKPGLTKLDIETLKTLRIKKVLIKEGLPFAPNFLIGFLITIFYGNLLSFLW